MTPEGAINRARDSGGTLIACAESWRRPRWASWSVNYAVRLRHTAGFAFERGRWILRYGTAHWDNEARTVTPALGYRVLVTEPLQDCHPEYLREPWSVVTPEEFWRDAPADRLAGPLAAASPCSGRAQVPRAPCGRRGAGDRGPDSRRTQERFVMKEID